MTTVSNKKLREYKVQQENYQQPLLQRENILKLRGG